MNEKIRFSTFILCLAVLTFLSACQRGDDDDDDGINQNTIDEIGALPEDGFFPSFNPYSDAKFDLGQALFWDPVLSGSKNVACASCHHPNFGYADGRDLSSGVNGAGLGPDRINGTIVKRNAPTILNTAFNGIEEDGTFNPDLAPMFWDIRAMGLEEQALLPILSKEEMRGELINEADIIDTLVERLNLLVEYKHLFENAFGTNEINGDRIAAALSTFQRNLVANNSRFDEYMRGNLTALSNNEIEGMHTFIEVGCANCHSGPMLSDFELHTLSVPDHPLIADNGATGNFDFRTPSLRNLAFTAPYMHNGHFDDLEDVLEFYNDISGGNGDSQNPLVNDNEIDNDAENLDLNRRDIDEILLFLNTLNDDSFDKTIPQTVPSGLAVGGNLD